MFGYNLKAEVNVPNIQSYESESDAKKNDNHIWEKTALEYIYIHQITWEKYLKTRTFWVIWKFLGPSHRAYSIF